MEPNTLDQFRSLTSAWQYAPAYRLVRRWLPEGARVLDWGAGSGHFSIFLCRAGYRTVGYSLEPCEFNRWRPPPPYEFVQSVDRHPSRLPFPTGSFDAVCSIGVLEHVGESSGSLEESLAEIRRVLRPGGIFLCCHLPNRLSLVEAVARLLPGKYHHERLFHRSQIRHLLSRAGLECLDLRRYGILPRNLFSALPGGARRSPTLAGVWSALDGILTRLAPFACQNWSVAARASLTRQGIGPHGGPIPTPAAGKEV